MKNLNNCAAALENWDLSEKDGAIQKTNLYKALLQNREECTRKP